MKTGLPFLLEIGSEEIPDWMIPAALTDLSRLFQEAVPGATELKLDATARRLALRCQLPEKQEDADKHTVGPSVSAPPKAVEGFAKKQGVAVSDLTQADGKYVAIKRVLGRHYRDILAEALPGVILGIYFPKTMYWTAKNGPRFIRPIRWLVALLGEETVPFEIAGVRSNNLTSGHRRLGAREIVVTTADYEQRLADHKVILSAEARRKQILDGIAALGVKVKPDPSLLEVLVYLTEFPTPIAGSFDKSYLELPEEVLITVMRHHQKYFSVEAADGALAPQFVAVMNIPADPEGFVRTGNERVLKARFNDARFFWDSDQKKKLADRKGDLASVTFQAKLGSYLEKTNRVMTLVAELGGDAHAVRAAELLKCDLTTELVKEFTELQGVVGGLYARVQGEPEPVWQSIYDQYKPASMEDSIPRHQTSRLVSIADKLDTLRGCFSIGMIPTGSRDPFALRRAAQGVVKIIVEGKMNLDLHAALNGDKALTDFFAERVKFYFKDHRGFAYDEVNAAMAAGWSDLVDLETRLLRIQTLRPTPDFEPLAASFKRIRNILEKGDAPKGASINAALLEPGPEHDLYSEYQSMKGQPIETTISRLRPKVDLFFDKVLVNAPDPLVRQNRLALLQTLLAEFSSIADFSEIVTNS